MIRLASEAARRMGLLAAMALFCGVAQGQPLPGTALLQEEGDLAAKMLAGMDRYLLRALDASGAERQARWQADMSSPEAYGRSLAAARQRFRTRIGAVDVRAAAGRGGLRGARPGAD